MLGPVFPQKNTICHSERLYLDLLSKVKIKVAVQGLNIQIIHS